MSPVDNTPTATAMGLRKAPARTDYRLRELERARVAAQGVAATTAGDEFPGYSVPGIVPDGTVLPYWYAQMRDHPYVAARVSAVGVPGGAGSEFHLAQNGSTIAVLTLGAGEQTHLYVVSFTVLLGDNINGIVVTGGGAVNWSFQLEEVAA